MDLRRVGLSRNRDAIYFIAPKRDGGYRVVKVVEHGPYHDKRPATWRGPYASDYDARIASWDLVAADRAAREEVPDVCTPHAFEYSARDRVYVCGKCGETREEKTPVACETPAEAQQHGKRG